MISRFLHRFEKNRDYLVVLILLIVLSAVAHGYNMFNFPYYENDEGTYMAQAWSFLNEGKLSHYTYWYDHAPGGWIFLALWIKLTGLFTFGTAIDSGRMFMLVLHVASVILLFNIARRLGRGMVAGTIAVLIFSLSPTAIYFQRRVLLDNIMIFWVLLSLVFLLKEKLKLRHIALSAACFGLAFLTKENAIFLLPAFLYTIRLQAHKNNRSFAIVQWIVISGLISSTYFLYALLKNEFFPAVDGREHVSLLSSLHYQLGRGSDYPFWDKRSDFFSTLVGIYHNDPFIILSGILSTAIGLIFSFKLRSLRITSFFALMFWIFLVRGKLIINFYIVPLIPLIALNIGVIFEELAQRFGREKVKLRYALAIFGVIVAVLVPISTTATHYIRDETLSQKKAIEWIRENIPSESYIVIDSYAYLDLKKDGMFPNADWYYKLQYDPEIQKKFGDGFKNVEYLLLSHNMLNDFKEIDNNLIKPVFEKSYLLKRWDEGSISFTDTEKYKSTYGDWAMLYQVRDENQMKLLSTWNYYKDNFIFDYGKVVDPASGNTTSEGQSYALLRAVWVDDKSTFDGVYQWAKDHLAHRLKDNLFSWYWINDDGEGYLGDSATAADADQDIAFALLFAYKKWGDEKYIADAREIISDIWKQEVVSISGQYYMKLGAGVSESGSYLINPSYLSPASYRIFAEVDPYHAWGELAHDSYTLLNEIAQMTQNPSSLPLDWVNISATNGSLSIASSGQSYGFDAFRTMCRVAQDYLWFGSQESLAYLNRFEPFFRNEYESYGSIAGVYSHSGERTVEYESVSTSAGALCNLAITNRNLATRLYREKFEQNLVAGQYWSDSRNYYDQNWAWFATALYTGNMGNLWN